METPRAQPFIDAAMHELRRRQHEVLLLLPDHVRDPLLPAGSLPPSPDEGPLVERALRERVDTLLTGSEVLTPYLERLRRDRLTAALARFVDRRWSELAGDAATAMEAEVAAANEALDPTVSATTPEEWAALARVVPLIAWADQLAARSAEPTRADAAAPPAARGALWAPGTGPLPAPPDHEPVDSR